MARNIESGFKACGLFPLSLEKMRTIVEDEIPKLPIPPRKSTGQKHKRVEVGGRLLTHELLLEIEATKTSFGTSKRRAAK
ncbi:hypothetical protein PC120_g13348 [Phytophthora cactorum]|nr:hypothetical protein PC120_g13348 [Phytophthora cactorum]